MFAVVLFATTVAKGAYMQIFEHSCGGLQTAQTLAGEVHVGTCANICENTDGCALFFVENSECKYYAQRCDDGEPMFVAGPDIQVCGGSSTPDYTFHIISAVLAIALGATHLIRSYCPHPINTLGRLCRSGCVESTAIDDPPML